MMFESDLGDIIYLLAIVLFGIIGAVGKGKKKKRPFVPDSEDSTPPTFWEELKREMQGEEMTVDTFETVQSEAYDQPEPIVDNQQPIISSPLEQMESYTYTQERLNKESIEYSDTILKAAAPKKTKRKSAHVKKKITLRLNDVEELKKGIIYAEIFNRKYI